MDLSSLRYSCAALCALLLGSCQPPKSSSSADGTLQLGPAGAWQTADGRMAHQGLEHAVEELNQQRGAGGRTIGITYRDDQSEGGLAANIAREFVDNPQIAGVIGHLSSTAMVAAARVYDGQLPVLSPLATSPDLGGASTWLFRLYPSDSVTGRRLSAIARRQAPNRRDTRGYTTGPVRFSATGDPIGRTMPLLHIDGTTRNFGVMQ